MRRLLQRLGNPYNLTAVHLARGIARHGDTVGEASYGRPAVRRWGEGARLQVGRYCSFADGVTIFLGGQHRTDWGTTYPFSDFREQWPSAAGLPSTLWSRGDVRIGSDVWIGSGATILSGVTIGNGAVIGARALVSRDVAPYAIAVGNPAVETRLRFTPMQVARLLETAWWNLPRETIAMLIPLLQSADIDALLERLDAIRAGADAND